MKNKFVPPPGKRLLIVGQDVANIDAYLEAAEDAPGGFATYTSIQDVDGLTAEADHGGGRQFAQSLADKHPNAVLQVGVYMVDCLDEVASGRFDPRIGSLGKWVQSLHRPVFLRLGYEFDLPENKYDPVQYIAAYRRIVDQFRRAGVDNAAFVWHSFAAESLRSPMDWYPGDDYVDWFAISVFGDRNREMDAMADLAKKHGKPLMIAESAPWYKSLSRNDAAWKYWFVPLIEFMEEKDVKALSYINCDWDALPLFHKMGWGDTRLQSNPAVLEKWSQETSRDVYLKSSEGLFETLGYIE